MGPAGTTPQRAQAIEDALCGQPIQPRDYSKSPGPGEFHPQLPHQPAARATAAYRYHLCKILLAEVLTTAWERSLLSVEEK